MQVDNPNTRLPAIWVICEQVFWNDIHKFSQPNSSQKWSRQIPSEALRTQSEVIRHKQTHVLSYFLYFKDSHKQRQHSYSAERPQKVTATYMADKLDFTKECLAESSSHQPTCKKMFRNETKVCCWVLIGQTVYVIASDISGRSIQN